MDNLWILTEERPKSSVIEQIAGLYEKDFSGIIEHIDRNNVKIRPVFNNGLFSFEYIVEGIKIRNINRIVIKTVSGSFSFFDFIEQKHPSLGAFVFLYIIFVKYSFVLHRNTKSGSVKNYAQKDLQSYSE